MSGRLLAGFRQPSEAFQRPDWHGRQDAWSGGLGIHLDSALSVMGCRLGFGEDCAMGRRRFPALT